jgi:hypothetical protein
VHGCNNHCGVCQQMPGVDAVIAVEIEQAQWRNKARGQSFEDVCECYYICVHMAQHCQAVQLAVWGPARCAGCHAGEGWG